MKSKLLRIPLFNRRGEFHYLSKSVFMKMLFFTLLYLLSFHSIAQRYRTCWPAFRSCDPGFYHSNNSNLLKDSHYWYNKGYTATENNNFDEALDDFTKAINLDSTYSEAYNYRGLLRCHFTDYYKALMDFDNAIKFNPKEASAYNNRAAVFEELNMIKVAIRDYKKAVQLAPFTKRYKTNLSDALEKDTLR